MDLVNTVHSAFEAYQQFQQVHPLLGSIATAEVFFPAGDLISQALDRKLDLRKTLYTAALAPAYGLTIHGLVEAGNSIGQLVDFIGEKGAEWNYALTKAALGPNLDGLLFNAVFFLNNTFGRRGGYHLGKLVDQYWSITSHPEIRESGFAGRIKALRRNLHDNIPRAQFMNACLGSLTVWNAFHAANYTYIPEELRTPATVVGAFVWTCILSVWSTRGSKKLVQQD